MASTSQDAYVLIVEDHAPVRDLYHSALRAAGYAAIGVEDGMDALRLVERRIPRAVVLDLSLPHLSGRDVLKALKAHTDTRAIPIIIVTGALDTTDLNPDDVTCVLRKPVSVAGLIAALDACLQRNAGNRWC